MLFDVSRTLPTRDQKSCASSLGSWSSGLNIIHSQWRYKLLWPSRECQWKGYAICVQKCIATRRTCSGQFYTWSNCLVHAADVQCFKMETFTHEDSRNEIFSKAPEGSDTDVEVDVEAKGSL